MSILGKEEESVLILWEGEEGSMEEENPVKIYFAKEEESVSI